MSRSTARNSGKTSPAGVLVALTLWLTVGFLPILSSLGDLRLAFGLAGEPGMAVVVRCVDYESGTSDGTECRGRFEPDDHRVAPSPDVHLPPESDEGETFPAQLAPGGERARPTGVQGRLAAVSLPALGLFFLVPLPWAVAYMIRGGKRAPHRVSLYAMGVLAAATGGLCVVGLVAASM